jgi:hypothetical protein
MKKKRFVPKKCIGSLRSICSYFVYGEFFEVSGINCSIENPSFVTAVISAAQIRFSRPCFYLFIPTFFFFLKVSLCKITKCLYSRLDS